MRFHVVINMHEKCVEQSRSFPLHDAEHFQFPSFPMRDQLVNDSDWLMHYPPMAWRQRLQRQRPEAGQGFQVGFHITVGRQDDRRGTLQDMITGKKQTVPFKKEADMIGYVSRCMHRLQTESITLDNFAVSDYPVRGKGWILMQSAFRRWHAN